MLSVLCDFPGMMYRPAKLRKLFASRACRKSVMIGSSLTMAQMEKVCCFPDSFHKISTDIEHFLSRKSASIFFNAVLKFPTLIFFTTIRSNSMDCFTVFLHHYYLRSSKAILDHSSSRTHTHTLFMFIHYYFFSYHSVNF